MAGDQSQFHDPELKAAVIRARSEHTASPDLRAKVMQRMAEVRAEIDRGGSDGDGSNGDSLKMPSRARPWYLTRTFFAAAAAILVIAIAGGSYYAHLRHEEEDRQNYIDDNRTLLLSMIGAYNGECDRDPARQVITEPTDPRALSAELTKRLGRDVPAVNIPGWKVESVSICKVGPADRTGHWHLVKDGQRMTVVSLPKSAVVIEEEYEDYDLRLNNHPIAGFVRKDSINCVVCEPSVSDREAIRLRDELKRG